jgi:hypothetical protein
MDRLTVLFAACLISAAIIFHGFSGRFDFVRVSDSGGFFIDRMTGDLFICGISRECSRKPFVP